MRKLKILTLCYEYPPVGGGGGRVAAQISEALSKEGHDVCVATSGMKHLPVQEKINGVKIHRFACLRRREDTCSVPEMVFYLVGTFLPTLRLVRKWKPHVIHVHFAVPTGAVALPIHWMTGIPYILTAHLGDVPGGVPEQTGALFKFLGPFIRPIWKYAAAATAVSSFVANLARKAYAKDIEVILNGVPASPAPAIVPRDPVKLLFVGRLSVQKNPLALVAIAKRIAHLNWHLDIIGEGPFSAGLQAAMSSTGLRDRVEFHGWKAAREVREAMLRSDILLMPSRSEGLPMAAIEALHCGMTIVGSDIPGLQDVVVNGRNGDLCAMEDLESRMADAVELLIKNPERLLSYRKEGLARAAHFDLAKSVAAYEEVLQRAVESTAISNE
ncbi:MAG: glycosyltransferase family 4 protein [Chthoniobacterales bacterium]